MTASPTLTRRKATPKAARTPKPKKQPAGRLKKQPIAFITGIAGFAGSFLAEELIAHGWAVCGSVYQNEPLDNLVSVRKQLTLLPLDILNPRRCNEVIAKVEPDYVFHLAAMASVGKSFGNERFTYQVNLDGTLNMLEAAGRHKGLIKFLFVSSGDSFGRFTPKNKTLTEDQPLNPISPYGIAKAAAEQTVRYYHRQYGLPAVVARPFNHAGPRQADSFVIPAFAKQIALIEAGKQAPELKVGDLSARRDFSDVRDIARGYRLLAEKGKLGETYHLCSGKAVPIKRVLKIMVDMANKPIKVVTDPARLRKNDIPLLRGSFEKARKQVGFDVRYSLKETLAETLAYWRARVIS